ncbi:hypothetical protein SPHINGO8AM_60022 [Sphingomonas sp. 8AM]|nr:hypothetical protein SPHINGO8AM_60022 [Sphingomonas sp. 8AM]
MLASPRQHTAQSAHVLLMERVKGIEPSS